MLHMGRRVFSVFGVTEQTKGHPPPVPAFTSLFAIHDPRAPTMLSTTHTPPHRSVGPPTYLLHIQCMARVPVRAFSATTATAYVTSDDTAIAVLWWLWKKQRSWTKWGRRGVGDVNGRSIMHETVRLLSILAISVFSLVAFNLPIGHGRRIYFFSLLT